MLGAKGMAEYAKHPLNHCIYVLHKLQLPPSRRVRFQGFWKPPLVSSTIMGGTHTCRIVWAQLARLTTQ